MHAHNINTKIYKETKNLFEKINKQIEEEIDKIIKIAEEEPEKMATSNFNSELSLAMQEFDWVKKLREIGDALKSPELLALKQQLSESIAEANKIRSELTEIFKNSQHSEIETVIQSLSKIYSSK